MGKSLRKWSGLKFVQDYAIPNSTHTKNPTYRKLGMNKWLGEIPGYSISGSTAKETVGKLKGRLTGAYILSGVHAIQIPWNLFTILDKIESSQNVSMIIMALLINLYCTLNQIDIRSRLKRVITHKEKEKRGTEKELDEVMSGKEDEKIQETVNQITEALEEQMQPQPVENHPSEE